MESFLVSGSTDYVSSDHDESVFSLSSGSSSNESTFTTSSTISTSSIESSPCHLKKFKFWTKLPPAFQQNVVKQLDYKSRCCMRKSSSLNRDLIDSTPLIMSYITMKTDRIYNPQTKQLDEQVVFSVFTDKWKCVNLHGVDDFLALFKNKRSVAQSFWFDCFDENKPCVPKFLQDLEAEMEKRGSVCKIRARKIQWNNNFKLLQPKGKVQKPSTSDAGDHFLKILNLFDSKYLRSLDLVKSNFTSGTINMLAKSEHWWLLKEINLELQQKTVMDFFLTAEKLQYASSSFTGPEIWKVVQSYQSRNLPRGSHFQLTVNKPWDVEEVLKCFQVPLRDEPIGGKRSPFIKHTQRWKTRNADLILVVQLNSEVAKGVICRVDHIEEDFGKE
ncbi:Protein CBG17911 [Caenorhabditis briggsae]|uniref:F-box domain-containing protein n=3 Tax=Caenorhabditis briggsae TaxID=6238 RepID=A0AAE9CYS5_CAEBR|nr:Protein CBG17911 [Caenorhabditis briggsae]ULT87767.1 hypothetical protein L3Y34_007143 [Caenorhabditis briggsae]CAP35451.2 Protein CBG17911 [Caenorhabditis briggsae]